MARNRLPDGARVIIRVEGRKIVIEQSAPERQRRPSLEDLIAATPHFNRIPGWDEDPDAGKPLESFQRGAVAEVRSSEDPLKLLRSGKSNWKATPEGWSDDVQGTKNLPRAGTDTSWHSRVRGSR